MHPAASVATSAAHANAGPARWPTALRRGALPPELRKPLSRADLMRENWSIDTVVNRLIAPLRLSLEVGNERRDLYRM